jgi:phage-related protein
MSTPAGDGALAGDATIRVDGDTDPATRALARFSRDAQGRIRDVRGRFVSETALINRTITNNTPTLTINTGPATNALNQFTRDVNGRLRDVNGRFVTSGTTINQTLTRAAGGGDRFGFSLRNLAGAARTAAGILGKVSLGIGAIGAAAGTAAPLLAGIVTTLENIAPAGAVAVTGMLAVTQATAVIRLGMAGVSDAATAAFDTSEAGAKKFDEALKKLAPNARSFALQVKELQPAFQRFQQGIQNQLFAGFAGELQRLSTTVMPVVRKNLDDTAVSLNRMALGAGAAARGLATSGTLGKAMAGANQGLTNLQKIPGQVVTALGQLATAGAPAFDRLTAGAAGFATGISEKLNSAFESGALTDAVNTAVDVLKDLGTVAGNVFGILGNVMAPVQAAGGGLVGTLTEITGALRDATATEGFQSAISAVAQVMATLAQTAGPLLGQALAAIGPIFTTLQGPATTLIQSLGAGLSPIIGALGPVLQSAAGAVGVLVEAAAPLLPVVGQLAASLLPALVPILDAAQTVFAALAPVVQTLSQTLQATLAPILAQLPGIVGPLANMLAGQLVMGIQLLGGMLVKLAPSFVSLGQSVGQLMAQAAPLISMIAGLSTQLMGALLPAIQPVINVVVALASALAGQLASTLTNLIMPALRLVGDLLRGDFSAAWNSLKALVSGVVSHFTGTLSRIGSVVGSIVQGVVDRFKWLYNILIGNSIIPDMITGIVGWFTRLPGMAFSALASLTSGIARIATTALSRFRSAIVSGATTAINFVRGIPGRARSALTALGGLIASVATSAFSRFRSAISSGASNAISFVRGIPGRIRGALGNAGSILYSAGRNVIQGMINGVKAMAGSLVSAAKGVVSGAVEGAKSLLGISSPSKVFAQIGRDTGAGFIKGLTGTEAQIKAAAEKVTNSITKAFRGRRTRVDDRLVSLVQSGNRRLQSLAGQRDSIAKRIADAQKFATDLTAKARATGSLSSIVSEDFFAPSYVEKQMRKSLAQIKSFTANVTKLQKKGLSKDLIRQILEMGPEAGAQFAASLAGADKATIQRFNKLQGQIGSASSKLGKQGADLLFDSGKKAGAGFLTGLKAQQKNIEKLMLSIARGMQRAIRKALGIRSPSRVMASVGRMTVLGLQGGITRMVPAVDQAMARVAQAVTTGVPTTLPAALGGTGVPALGVGAMRTAGRPTAGATVNITLQLTNHGVIGSRMEAENWLARALVNLDRTGRLPKSLRAA